MCSAQVNVGHPVCRNFIRREKERIAESEMGNLKVDTSSFPRSMESWITTRAAGAVAVSAFQK
jgi:hypothetical protein